MSLSHCRKLEAQLNGAREDYNTKLYKTFIHGALVNCRLLRANNTVDFFIVIVRRAGYTTITVSFNMVE